MATKRRTERESLACARRPVAVRVVQSVVGRFHHFDLARQLDRHGCLTALFTAYPRWKLRGERLPPDRVQTFPWILTPWLAMGRWGWRHATLDRAIAWQALETLDRHVAAKMPACDVLVAISGCGLHSSRRVRDWGGRYICDRGSSHIRVTDQLLREEFERWKVPFQGIDRRVMDKEEREYAAADVITIPSGFCAQSFTQAGVDPSKLRVIPYGAELAPRAQPSKRASKSFRVLFVGQISFRKGVPYLLEAFDRLRHSRKVLTLVGAIQPEMRSWSRRAVGAEVEWLGSQPRARVRQLMSEADVLVLPSIEDGFGLVLLEAMACGLPVIASVHTGAPDLVTDGQDGYIVPIRDAAALADRLARLSEDRALRESMGHRAIERVRAMGGWNDYGDAFAALVAELAREGA